MGALMKRAMRRVIGSVYWEDGMDGDLCDMKRVNSDSWDRSSNSLSYAEAWIRKFMPNGNYKNFC
jgi:hypothetical protein